MFSKFSQYIKTQKCVFPTANTPLKKVICGTVGLGAAGAGCAAGTLAIKNAIDRTIEHRRAVAKETKSFENDDGEKNSSFFSENAIISVGAGATYFGAAAARVLTMDWVKEGKLFRSTLRDTKCCNIVRSTARFSCLSFMYLTAIPTCVGISLFGGMWSSALFLHKFEK